ncbi:MAG: MMPL family transporter [SAR324 cluster bacterium]|nr:MMPL family transporter [SAR324 cluster bacterium]
MLKTSLHRLLKYPQVTIALTLGISLLLSIAALRGLFDDDWSLIIDSSLGSYISSESRQYEFYQQSRAQFGNEEVMALAVRPQAGGRQDIGFFLRMHRLARAIEAGVPSVSKVFSATNAPRLSGACSGKSYFHQETAGTVCESILERYPIELRCLQSGGSAQAAAGAGGLGGQLGVGLDEQPALAGDDGVGDPQAGQTPTGETAVDGGEECAPGSFGDSVQELSLWADAAVAEAVAGLRKDPLIRGDLISGDFKTFGMLVQFGNDAQPARAPTQEALAALLENANGLRIAYTGQPRHQYETARTFRKDVANILPFSVAIMMIVLAFAFRTVRGVLIPLCVVLLGLTSTAGVFALAGEQLNPVLMVLPPLLICVGSAYVIFFMNRYFLSAKTIMGKRAVVAATIDDITVPLGITALTTIAGFAALIVSPIPAIKTMGIYACLGVGVVILLSLTLVPAILVLCPLPKRPPVSKTAPSWLDKGLATISELAGRGSRYFIYIWIGVGAVAVLGLLQLQVNSDAANFAEDTPIMRDLRFIEDELAGSSSLRIVWRHRNSPAQLVTAKTMGALDLLSRAILDENPASPFRKLADVRIDKVYSPVPLLRLRYGDPATLSDLEVRRFFQLLRKEQGPKFISGDGQWLQMTLRMKVGGSRAFLELRELLQAKIGELMPGFEVRFTGGEVLASVAADNIAKGQIQSIALALIIIFVILSLLFLSPKMGLLALYPNILTISVYFGFLGWLGIPLGVTISVIAAIALGLGVDDTIHYLAHYNDNVKSLRNEREAAMLTVRQVGRPMVFTTMALALGFLVFTVSEMETQILFGALLAFTLLVCLFTDLNFLPSIMARTRLITVWDYLGLDFTEEFIRRIPLFNGMTMRETKLATLMAYPVELAQGEVVFAEQETGREMFLVLSGSVEIYFDAKLHGQEQLLATLPAGTVFGEMGLFRQQERVASARAAEASQLLAVNEDVLNNLQRKSPRAAAKLFLNIAGTLSERIHRSDEQFADKVAPKSGMDRLVSSLRSMVEQVRPTDTEVRKIVDEIVADGVVTVDERRALETRMYADGRISPAERRELQRLERMIESGEVTEERDQFISMLHKVEPRQAQWLIRRFPQRHYEAGSVLWKPEDVQDAVMLVLSGKLFVSQEIEGRAVPIRTIYKDELVGEEALFSAGGRAGDMVTAAEPAEVLLMRKDDFDEIIAKKKALAAQLTYNLVRMLSDRLQEANVRLYT